MALDILAHLIGLAALAVTIASLLHRSDRGLLVLNGLASVLWAANSLLLGANSAAALGLLSALRATSATAVQGRGVEARWRACAVFLAATGVATAVTWQGWPSLLPAGASLCATVAFFCLAGVRLRLTLLLSWVLWLCTAWHFRAVEQCAGYTLAAGAAAIGTWRARQGAVRPPV